MLDNPSFLQQVSRARRTTHGGNKTASVKTARRGRSYTPRKVRVWAPRKHRASCQHAERQQDRLHCESLEPNRNTSHQPRYRLRSNPHAEHSAKLHETSRLKIDSKANASTLSIEAHERAGRQRARRVVDMTVRGFNTRVRESAHDTIHIS